MITFSHFSNDIFLSPHSSFFWNSAPRSRTKAASFHGGSSGSRLSGSILRKPAKVRSSFHSPPRNERQGNNSNHVSWNHNAKSNQIAEEEALGDGLDVLGDGLDSKSARHYVAKEEKQDMNMANEQEAMSSSLLSFKWDRLISQKKKQQKKSRFAEEKEPTSNGELDSPGAASQGESEKYTSHDSDTRAAGGIRRSLQVLRSFGSFGADNQGSSGTESLVGRGVRRTLKVLESFGSFGAGPSPAPQIDSRDPTPEHSGRASGDNARQRPIKRRSLVGRATDALRSKNQSRDPDQVHGGRESTRAPTIQQQPARQARPKKRESILNMLISFTSKSENKHDHEHKQEDDPSTSDNDHAISGTDRAARFGITDKLEGTHQDHDEMPSSAPTRSRRGSLTNLIISFTTKKKPVSTGGSTLEEEEDDDDSCQVEDIRVDETDQRVDEPPVISRQPRAEKRGSIGNLIKSIKNINLAFDKKLTQEKVANEEKERQHESNGHKSSRGSELGQDRRRRRRPATDELRNSATVFDKIASEKFNQSGTLMDEFRRERRTTVSTCATSVRMSLTGPGEYQDKISSILYDGIASRRATQ